jgi:exodeoxyribonuclease V gamma subunit
MFLETLLSTRDRLVLSYVARDELSGAPLAPSSVLLELRDLLAAGYLPPAEVQTLFAPPDRPPLRRYDDAARVRAGTLAHREAGAKRLGQSLRAALPSGAAVPDLQALRRTLDQDRFDPLARRLGVNGPPAAAGRSVLAGLAPGERLVVPLSAIRQFLEDPLQGSARFRLRLREVEGDEELIDREQEAFVTDRPLRAGLLREIMQRVVAAGEPGWGAIEAMLATVVRREELRPAGTTSAARSRTPPARRRRRGRPVRRGAESRGRPRAGRIRRTAGTWCGGFRRPGRWAGGCRARIGWPAPAPGRARRTRRRSGPGPARARTSGMAAA